MHDTLDTHLTLQVSRFQAEAKDVAVLELQATDGSELPAFSPGAHLELQLGNGLARHYSLLGDPRERRYYRIAVGLSPQSRGGSRFVHESLRLGDRVRVSTPRNHFELKDDAARYCFVAGGIGITPILSMIRWCEAQGKTWRLVYAVRNRQRAAFHEELCTLGAEQVSVHASDEHQGRHLDADALLASLGPEEHLYCCGPAPLMQAIRDSGRHIAERLHFEWFAAPDAEAPGSAADGEIELVLRRSGQTLRVTESQSILETLEAHGHSVPYACRAGICRTCETRVRAGEPDHRDFVLSDEERACGQSMLICVSRALGSRLELDL